MNRLEMILSAMLLLSVILNIGIFVYARTAISHLLLVSEELGDLQQIIDTFASHIKTVYELDTFYGDQTLEHLLHHAVSLGEQLETFEYIYSLTEREGIEVRTDDKHDTDNTEEIPDEISSEI